MQLLKSQLNSFYEALDSFGFSLGDFHVQADIISERYDVEGSCINYSPENYYFNCGEKDGVYYCVHSPSDNKLVDDIRSVNWSDIQKSFIKWVKALRKEISQIDKWDMLRKAINAVNIRVTDSEDRFTYNEVIEIQSRIILLKEKVSSIPFTQEQITLINQKLDYLAEAAQDAKKFDWGNLFVGMIVTIILNLSVTPENASLLWNAIKQVFNNYVLLN